MKSKKHRVFTFTKFGARIGLATVIAVTTSGLAFITQTESFAAKSPQVLSDKTVSQVPQQFLSPTQQQLDTLRSVLINNANRIPNLNLSLNQINAILSYFDADPSMFAVSLSPQQIAAVRAYVANNFNGIANYRPTIAELNTAIVLITSNAGGITNLVNNNPDVASLIRSLAPQINQISILNQPLNIAIQTLRANVPVINSLLSI